jgi:hypothetical protein
MFLDLGAGTAASLRSELIAAPQLRLSDLPTRSSGELRVPH